MQPKDAPPKTEIKRDARPVADITAETIRDLRQQRTIVEVEPRPPARRDPKLLPGHKIHGATEHAKPTQAPPTSKRVEASRRKPAETTQVHRQQGSQQFPGLQEHIIIAPELPASHHKAPKTKRVEVTTQQTALVTPEVPRNLQKNLTSTPVNIERPVESKHLSPVGADYPIFAPLPKFEGQLISANPFEGVAEPLLATDTFAEGKPFDQSNDLGADSLPNGQPEGLLSLDFSTMSAFTIEQFRHSGEESNPFAQAPQAYEQPEISSKDTAQGVGLPIEAELLTHLDKLSTSQAKKVNSMIDDLGSLLRESQPLTETDIKENKADFTHRAEEICEELFELLGIAQAEGVTIQRFVETIIARAQPFAILHDALTAEELNNRGTWEYARREDNSLLGALSRFITQKVQPHLLLGRYALRSLQAIAV